jgi:hypothetical protein
MVSDREEKRIQSLVDVEYQEKINDFVSRNVDRHHELMPSVFFIPKNEMIFMTMFFLTF